MAICANLTWWRCDVTHEHSTLALCTIAGPEDRERPKPGNMISLSSAVKGRYRHGCQGSGIFRDDSKG